MAVEIRTTQSCEDLNGKMQRLIAEMVTLTMQPHQDQSIFPPNRPDSLSELEEMILRGALGALQTISKFNPAGQGRPASQGPVQHRGDQSTNHPSGADSEGPMT